VRGAGRFGADERAIQRAFNVSPEGCARLFKKRCHQLECAPPLTSSSNKKISAILRQTKDEAITLLESILALTGGATADVRPTEEISGPRSLGEHTPEVEITRH
jgi:hypothetical protein